MNGNGKEEKLRVHAINTEWPTNLDFHDLPDAPIRMHIAGNLYFKHRAQRQTTGPLSRWNFLAAISLGCVEIR